jgi:hypothetical protein
MGSYALQAPPATVRDRTADVLERQVALSSCERLPEMRKAIPVVAAIASLLISVPPATAASDGPYPFDGDSGPFVQFTLKASSESSATVEGFGHTVRLTA